MSLDVSQITKLLNHYDINSRVSANFDTYDLTSNGPSHIESFGTGHISVEFEIRNPEIFYKFVEDLSNAQLIADEEKTRKENPALQHAYDEYRIMLKLSR